MLNPNDYDRNDKILGAEALLWSEMNNEYDFLTKAFPHSSGMAFRYWNPDYSPSTGMKFETFMRLQYRLKAYDIPVGKVSMRYCEEHTHNCFGP